MKTKALDAASLLFWITCVILLSSCATLDGITGGSDSISYKITSTPNGSAIFVNGENKGSTPLMLTLEAKKKWVGVLVAPSGWKYENNFYFIEAIPSMIDKEKYLSDSTYINPRNTDQSNEVHFELPVKTSDENVQQKGFGKILGIQEPLLPTLNSAGYVSLLQINGQPLNKWSATPFTAELPAGRYSIATLCKWDLGIGGEVKIQNMWPINIDVKNGMTYQLKTVLVSNTRCRVDAKVSSK